MKKEVAKTLRNALKEMGADLSSVEIEKLISTPPRIEMGDYSFPCFTLAKQLKSIPHKIALDIRQAIGNSPKAFQDIQTSGPYVNFFVDRKIFSGKTVKEVLLQKEDYGTLHLGLGNTVVVEFSSPNIAKPFGIGHLRSTIIGNSLANIHKFQGHKVIRMNYLGDWGTQFGKLTFGFKKFGNANKLKKDSIKHLLDIYVKVNKNKKYDEPSREWFKKLEQGDKEAVGLWKKFRELSLKDFEKIYSLLGVQFDVYSGESMYEKEMKKVIDVLLREKLLKKSEGATIIDLNEYGLGVSLIQKADGATLYTTRDLAAAIDRYNKYKFEKMIYEVGQEQKLHFKQFFKILELMGCDWAKKLVHVDHGLYLGKDNKKFATRKGKTIFMEDIIEKTSSLAKKEIKKRFPKISKKELERRSLRVAIAAIFYGDLKNNRTNNMVFDINRFVSFEGDTGPYLLYSYARANSILKKVYGRKTKKKFFKRTKGSPEIHIKEFELIKKISLFHDVVYDAYKNLNPSIIANYSYQLASIFNEFYHSCPVINSEQEKFRLEVVESFKQVLGNSLKLLGIEPLEEM